MTQILQKNINLSDFSNYKIGGPAKYFFEANSLEDLKKGLAEFYSLKENVPIFILGEGTNVLINSNGFPGLVIKNSINFLSVNDTQITTGGGTKFSDLLDKSIETSLSGLEWAGGLPGTVGGAVRGNAGAFGGETKDKVITVKSINIKNLEEKVRNGNDCEFGYRMSVFKKSAMDEIITDVTFALLKGERNEIEKQIQEKINYRKERHPLDFPNIGSTFKNIPYESVPADFKEDFKGYIKEDPFPVVPVAKILALMELKGKREGGAMISDKHPNFIVNVNHASSEDVRKLIYYIKNAVYEKYGISLEEEIFYL